MLPIVHFLISLLFVVILYPIFGWNSLWIFLGGYFIDVDHYFLYVFKTKNYSLKKSYFYFKKSGAHNRIRKQLFIFHTIETILVLSFLAKYSEMFLIILIGLIFHMILDYIQEYIKYKTIKFPSIIYWYLKIRKNNYNQNKKKKK